MTKKRKKRGPKPEDLKIQGDWGDALKKALKKEKPAEGWPDGGTGEH